MILEFLVAHQELTVFMIGVLVVLAIRIFQVYRGENK